MPEFPLPAADAERQDVRRHGRRSTRGKSRKNNIRAFHLYISVLPTGVMAFLGFVAVAMLLETGPSATNTQLVLVMVAACAVITLGAAAYGADVASRRERRSAAPHQDLRPPEDVQRRLGELGFLVARGRQEVQTLPERIKAGESLSRRSSESLPAETNDPFMHLAYELQRTQNEAWNAALEAAKLGHGNGADHRVEVFVNLARRMQSLSHRAIQGLDELENQVEDPDLLKGLFRVDHLSTRMRRQAESLAVIGGATSRRQWSRPVTVYEVLRSAIAEVEHYNRVKVVPPIEGTLHGSAVADVIHLLAELIENATKFAPPHTQVLLRAETVTAGLAVEVEDRGLGIPPDSRRRLNDLLSDLDRINIDELLQDGRIGLLVVSALARRHGIEVQLQSNLYGGTQAVVVVPNGLLGSESHDDDVLVPMAKAPSEIAASTTPALSAPPREGGRHSAASTALPEPRPADPEPGTDAIPRVRADAGERPELPRRHAQANLMPELLNAPVPRSNDHEADHDPGLMAAFKRGILSGEEDDEPPSGTDSSI
jgi:signal transduction histidine kinase